MSATLAAARSAKPRLREYLASSPAVNGIGIVRSDNGYSLKVNLSETLPEGSVPTEIQGVPVRIAVVGRITPQTDD